MNKNFPINPFNIVDSKIFYKSTKKRFSEDYVHVNFELMNWNVYEPFQDVGTDRVITTTLCDNCKDSNNLDDIFKCKHEKNPFQITRFVQIKTREVSAKTNSEFGFTLKPRDFIPDPRVVFLLFSDYTNDFLIFTINDWIDLVVNKLDKGEGFFSTPTFKQENGKINSIKYQNKKWLISGRSDNTNKNRILSLDDYVNNKGLLRLYDHKIDKRDFDKKINLIKDFKNKYFFSMKKTQTFDDDENDLINKYIKINISESKDEKRIRFSKNMDKLDSLKDEVKDGIKKYFAKDYLKNENK